MLFGAIAGVLTAAVALGVGQLVSGLTVRQGSPAVVVGQAAIDLAPPPVKNFAISVFGANDKTALLIGILVVLAIVAAVIGVAAMRRLAYGYAGLVLFAAIGLAAALSRPDATFGYAVPTIFGAAAGAFALNRLTRAAWATIGRTALPGVPGSAGAPGSRGAPARDADRYEPGTVETGTRPTAEAEAGIPSETEAAPTAEAGTGPGTEAEAGLPSEAGTGPAHRGRDRAQRRSRPRIARRPRSGCRPRSQGQRPNCRRGCRTAQRTAAWQQPEPSRPAGQRRARTT